MADGVDEKPKYEMDAANRINRTGIAVVVGFAVLLFSLANGYYAWRENSRKNAAHELQQAKAQFILEQRLEQLEEISPIIFSIEESFRRIEPQVAENTTHRLCWPIGNCEGINQLPADFEQNARLDALETLVAIQRTYSREHCQSHRDNSSTTSERTGWQDCSEL